MKKENGSSKPQSALYPFGGKANCRPIWLLTVVGLLYGSMVVSVLNTSPLGRIAAMLSVAA